MSNTQPVGDGYFRLDTVKDRIQEGDEVLSTAGTWQRTIYRPGERLVPNLTYRRKERPMPLLTLQQAVEYEIAASWWAGWIGCTWLNDATASYFAWKATRKHRHYLKVKQWQMSREKA